MSSPDHRINAGPWIDGHLDLAYLGVGGRDLTRPHTDPASGCISLPELRGAGVTTLFGTIYTEPEAPEVPWGYSGSADREAAFATGKRQLDLYHQLADRGEIRLIRSAADLDRAEPVPGVVLLMEGADPIRSPDDVAWWHERGVRLVGLTWALGTRYAGGNERHGSLTDEGRELVRELDRFGIVHDLSHLADAAFADLLEVARGPIVATHSNCRALLPDRQRHLTDDQIRAIAARDGVVGLNLFSVFRTRKDRATIDDCVAHIEHVCDIMGHRRGVVLGSDMDGGFPPSRLPVELDHPRHLDRLTAALKGRGWSEEEIAGFRHLNWQRILNRVLA